MYPFEWKKNILTPIHKSDSLTNPSNFRGVAVSSCMGKLFNKLLQKRLEAKCVNEGLININQGSGKKGSRTADHLIIIRFLIDKYVTAGGKKLFACFFDIRKAFDCVPRSQLFYKLLKDYKIGGKFLNIMQKFLQKIRFISKYQKGYANRSLQQLVFYKVKLTLLCYLILFFLPPCIPLNGKRIY